MGRTGFERAGQLVFVLALLNLLVFALGLVGQTLSRPSASLPEFNAEKIRLFDQPALKQARARRQQENAAREAALNQAAFRTCVELAGFDQVRFETLTDYLRQSAVGGTVPKCLYAFERPRPWWVFWPPEYELGVRDKVLAALKAAGVEQVVPVTEGPLAQAFMLQMFEKESDAEAWRNQLRGKGLEKVAYGPVLPTGAVTLDCAWPDKVVGEQFLTGLPPFAKASEAGCGGGRSVP